MFTSIFYFHLRAHHNINETIYRRIRIHCKKAHYFWLKSLKWYSCMFQVMRLCRASNYVTAVAVVATTAARAWGYRRYKSVRSPPWFKSDSVVCSCVRLLPLCPFFIRFFVRLFYVKVIGIGHVSLFCLPSIFHVALIDQMEPFKFSRNSNAYRN